MTTELSPGNVRLNDGLGLNAPSVERDPTHTLTLTQRCEIASKCLPPAEYRNRLERLHADMLAALDRALTVCRCAARVIDSSAYQGISDEDCDLEVAVRNWRALRPNR